MNTPLSLSRDCARRCCRPTTFTKQYFNQLQLLQIPSRSISSSAWHSFAQPIDVNATIETIPEDNTPFSHLQPELNAARTKKNPSRLPQDQNQPTPSQLFIGTVTRTGTMPQTVQITRKHLVYDPFIQKHYTRPLRLKAHDPNPASYLREGDVVEYGVYTQVEKDTKLAKDLERIAREKDRLEKADKSGKMVRKFQRNEAMKKSLKGKKTRGVQFVVRRVVTPFGVGLDERMERLAVQPGAQEESAAGGQDSLMKSLGGNISRSSGRAAVAG